MFGLPVNAAAVSNAGSSPARLYERLLHSNVDDSWPRDMGVFGVRHPGTAPTNAKKRQNAVRPFSPNPNQDSPKSLHPNQDTPTSQNPKPGKPPNPKPGKPGYPFASPNAQPGFLQTPNQAREASFRCGCGSKSPSAHVWAQYGV